MNASSSNGPVLSVLVPVYNEAGSVEQAIEELLSTDLGVDFEVIVVDDGSTDGTAEILARGHWPRARVRLLQHAQNQGKGEAVRTALAEADGEYSAIFDADLEYEPADIGTLLPPLLEGTTNVVFGERAFDGFTSHSFLFVLGNKGVTLTANVLFNVYLKDLMTMHKVIRTDLFRSLPLRERGFAIEPEIAAQLLNRGERIYELPVRYRARKTEEGKKLTWVDGLRVVKTLLRCRFGGRQELVRGYA